MRVGRNRGLSRKGYIGVWSVTIALVLGSGIVYRILAVDWKRVEDNPIKLPVPLKEFPLEINDWKGQEVAIPENILRVAKSDDHLSRAYFHKDGRSGVTIYVPYTARPRTMLGHRPQRCYPGAGWVPDGIEETTVKSLRGRVLPCLLHYFHRKSPHYEEIVVLNYYIVNGKITNDESVFSGTSWRTPNIDGDFARYVSQVQVISELEHTVRMAARDFSDVLLDYFPDTEGVVQAALDKEKLTPTTPPGE